MKITIPQKAMSPNVSMLLPYAPSENKDKVNQVLIGPEQMVITMAPKKDTPVEGGSIVTVPSGSVMLVGICKIELIRFDKFSAQLLVKELKATL